MSAYKQAYERLNKAQRQAVDQTDGPLLVIAGPGTGKTQLLSTRAAHIAQLGLVSAQNILCLTYTDAGASEMRNRLATIMGNAGSDVAVHTFHSFGSWIIDTHPELFNRERSLKPLDELTRHRLFESLLADLPLRHQLAVRDADNSFLRQGSVIETIRVSKQAGLTPNALRSILTKNQKDYAALRPLLQEIFNTTLSIKRLESIQELVINQQDNNDLGAYAHAMLQSLTVAIEDSHMVGKTKPLGDWRTKYMQTEQGIRMLKSEARHQALLDVVDLYEQYQRTLLAEGRYDYEDMVLWAITAVQNSEDLRLELAERFQYVMVDEYQDTNGAQNTLLNAVLQANPINTPNIMVVGDDDQAIMRFQGAELSGLLQFITTYQPTIVTLTDNYRSGQPILDASRQVITQTEDRLEAKLPDVALSKKLIAQGDIQATHLRHSQFTSPVAQYQGVAHEIANLVQQGVPAKDICVIGRKHKELEAIVPFLESQSLVVNYDYRENILDDIAITQLLDLAQYMIVANHDPSQAAKLLPRVLSAAYWSIPPLELYELAVIAKRTKQSWLDVMATHPNEAWQERAIWLIAATQALQHENFTTGLDILLGRTPLQSVSDITPPFASYFTMSEPASYIRTISHILRLRSAVLEHRPMATNLQDLLQVIAEYRHSGIKLVDNNPLLRGDAAGVTLLSAHGAKGREFDYVFILSAVDAVWGNRARGYNQRIHLPENLPLYPAGDTESDRLRLLYVAMTRAQSNLTITSYSQTDDGKAAAPLTYLMNNAAWTPETNTLSETSIVAALSSAWKPTTVSPRSLQNALQPLLEKYRLSPTGLRQFLDICYSGPETFLEQSVLGFPSTYTASSALGSAAHSVIEQAWKAHQNQPLSTERIIALFNEALDASGLPPEDLLAVRAHGEQFLPAFIATFAASDFGSITSTEQYFAAELGAVPFGGKIDALVMHENQLGVIDYKSGKPPQPDWQAKGLSTGKKISQHFYRQQLMCYKLLLDASPTMKGRLIDFAELVFIEPPETSDEFVRLRITEFSQPELSATMTLIEAVYRCLRNGTLPDTSAYTRDLGGILAFEQDLINGAYDN